jgi:hypothetical protein
MAIIFVRKSVSDRRQCPAWYGLKHEVDHFDTGKEKIRAQRRARMWRIVLQAGRETAQLIFCTASLPRLHGRICDRSGTG